MLRRKHFQNAFYILKHEGLTAFSRKVLHFILRDKIYQLWWYKNRSRSRDLARFKNEIQTFKYRPLVSLIMPVYNPPPRFLKIAIESVLTQIYPHFELCICDDHSTDPKVRALLQQYEKNPAIKITRHTKNQGIVTASNSALALATGEYVGFLDHDDKIAPNALYAIVKALQKQRFDLLYTDEDKLSPRGFHHTPFFKPNWSPDLLLSIMYFGHLCVYRHSLIQKLKGFRPGFDGSQDHDLALRATEEKLNIHHIPEVLYHWRQIPTSTAAQISVKPYTLKSARNALKDTLKRRKIDGHVQNGIWSGSYRVQYKIQNSPLVSIIIPFKDQVGYLQKCLKSIQTKTRYPNYEIILVNNRSQDPATQEFLAALKTKNYKLQTNVINYPQPFNFSSLNNFAVQHAKGEYLLFLNNDTKIINENWLEALLEHAQRPEIAAVGAKLLYPDQTIQHAGIIMGIAGTCSHAFRHVSDFTHGYLGQLDVIRNVSAVTGACLMMSREKFNKLKGFDPHFKIAYQDVDLCLRALQAGYLNLYTPFARLYHYEGKTRDPNKPAPIPTSDTQLLLKKWGDFIQNGDPYYNPNLTLKREDYSIC